MLLIGMDVNQGFRKVAEVPSQSLIAGPLHIEVNLIDAGPVTISQLRIFGLLKCDRPTSENGSQVSAVNHENESEHVMDNEELQIRESARREIIERAARLDAEMRIDAVHSRMEALEMQLIAASLRAKMLGSNLEEANIVLGEIYSSRSWRILNWWRRVKLRKN